MNLYNTEITLIFGIDYRREESIHPHLESLRGKNPCFKNSISSAHYFIICLVISGGYFTVYELS